MGDEKKMTLAQLGRAAAALGKGFRGRRVQLSAEQRSAAIRALRRHYKTMGAEHLPPVLAEAFHTDAARRVQQHAAKMAEVLVGDSYADAREALADLSEGGYYLQFLQVMDDGDLSYEAVIAAVAAALKQYHARYHQDQSPHSYDCSMDVKATFAGSVLYEMQGKLYRCSYTLEGTAAKIGDDHEEIVLEPAAAPLSEAVDLAEARPAATLREAGKVDRDAGTISGVVLINSESSNGPHGKRRYTDKALRQIAQMAEGLPAYVNHVLDSAQRFKPRDVREVAGRHRNVRFDLSGHRVLADFTVAPHQADLIFSLTETMADIVGFSPVSRGLVRMDGETEVVEEIELVRSVDLVSDPATTRGLFEHGTRPGANGDRPPQEGEMKLDEIIAHVNDKANAATRVALLEALAGDLLREKDKVLAAKDTELIEAKAAQVKTVAELTEAKARLDTFDTADKTRQKADRLAKALGESELGAGKRHAKNAHAVTDTFRAALMESAEDKWAGLIADRVAALDQATGERPRSAPKDQKDVSEGQSGIPEGTHAKLHRALVGSGV